MSEKRNDEASDLDLVPIMNLVTILIPFLLATATFVTLAVIDTSAPAICTDCGPPRPDTDEPVSVIITDQGYTVTRGPVEVTIPCLQHGCPAEASWDTAELSEALVMMKEVTPDEQTVILVAEPTVPYGVLVVTMDAARSRPGATGSAEATALFPEVVIAGGAY